MNKNKALQKLNDFQKNTITEVLGIEITDFGPDYFCGKMPVDHRTVQPYGLLHGGASAVLAETLGSIAGGMQVNLETQSRVFNSLLSIFFKGFKELMMVCGLRF